MSLTRLEDHRRIWGRKPALEEIYRVWFDALLAAVPRHGRVLEVGAGPGFLSAHARRGARSEWIATDIEVAPWNDCAADAQRLPIRDASVDAVVGIDVIHHLGHPGDLFAEAGRVLKPGGPLAVVEPWVTPFSYPIYRWFHQETCTLGLDPWNPFAAAASAKDAFEGDAAVLWRILKLTAPVEWSRFGLGAPTVTLLNGFAYLLSLGFRDASLLPRPLVRPLLWLDRRTRPSARYLGLRALAVWRRSETAAAPAGSP